MVFWVHFISKDFQIYGETSICDLKVYGILETVTHSEVSQKEKNKYRMLTHIYGI